MKDITSKYLSTYSEKIEFEIQEHLLSEGPFEDVVVIPALDEEASLPGLLSSLKCSAASVSSKFPALLILVLNSSVESSTAEQTQANERVLRSMEPGSLKIGPHLYFARGPLKILVLNRTSEGYQLPAQGGVGLARKIGCDLALWLWHQKSLIQNRIFSTDADAELPENYFLDGPQFKSTDSAAIFDFHHHPQHPAISAYENYLRYYVNGLKAAGSPYAFHSIGSCFAFSPRAYAAVRGFPKKEAGEDFYFLNKMAKVGSILSHTQIQIKLSSRFSKRTPFGTGQRIRQWAETLENSHQPLVNHPEVFIRLKELLDFLKGLSQQRSDRISALGASQLAFLSSLNFEAQLRDFMLHYKTEAALSKALMDWFDGFQTLKFIHFLRERDLPDLPLDQALRLAHR